MAVFAVSWMLFVIIVVLSSTIALPIETELEDYNRRNDIGLSYGEMRKAIDEAFQIGKRMDPFAATPENDDFDLKRYQDENLDYSLLEMLTNEMLEENGGNLDRKITDTEYEEISERYFKRLETEKATAWKTPPYTENGSKKFATTWATPTRGNTRSEDGNNTTTDHVEQTSHHGVNRPTTPHQDAIATTVTQTWKQTTARGTDSGQAVDHTKHFNWTGESKNGHQVHVVVYFEK